MINYWEGGPSKTNLNGLGKMLDILFLYFVNFSVFFVNLEDFLVFLLSFLIFKKVLLVPLAQWIGCRGIQCSLFKASKLVSNTLRFGGLKNTPRLAQHKR